MTAIGIEKYNIKGFPAPRPITSEAQNEYYTKVLYGLERRGYVSAMQPSRLAKACSKPGGRPA